MDSTTALSGRTEGQAFQHAWALSAVLGAVVGWLLAVAAWSPGSSPAIAVVLPLLWAISPNRLTAFAVTTGYHLGVVRFLPEFAGTWFDSQVAGTACWLVQGALSGAVWAIFWSRRSTSLSVVASTLAVLVFLLVSPAAALVPGHPIVAWGFLFPDTGWVGVALMFVASAVGVWFLRVSVVQAHRYKPWMRPVVVFVLACGAWFAGEVPKPESDRLAGRIGGVQTQLGGFPKYGSIEVMDRLGKIGKATTQLAGGDDGIQTVVFPETIIGLFDPSLYPAVELEILQPIRQTGQTVLIGADVATGPGRYQTGALIFRPDGTSHWIGARQAMLVAQWRPWDKDFHMPTDWFASSTATVGGGVRARIMFCVEEWIPILHLLSEAREDHQVVIAMSNLWAATDPLADYVQGAHSQGMARLFGRKLVRSVNLARPKN